MHIAVSNMKHLLTARNLFQLLLILYTAIILVIIQRLNDTEYHQTGRDGPKNILALHHDSQAVQNITKFIYINRTETIVKVKTVSNYGPGENGEKVVFPKERFTAEEQKEIEKNKIQHGFNTYVSDLVSLQRHTSDRRPQSCKDIVYPKDLPAASIVIIFRDEWWSVLLRTAYSVLGASPDDLVKEVILVDDGSKDVDLRRRVEMHVGSVDKFKLVRNNEPLGLMLARQKGIEAVTADYFVVLDGHMEVTPGWLEPLIYRLVQKPNALLCSHIGAIGQDDLKINIDDPTNIHQMFDAVFPFFDPLTLDQMWTPYSDEFRKRRNSSVEPLKYGTIQGMMTVMRKAYFMQLGGFDPGMRIWGSEQMELSIKVWMCGGVVEMVPCSKVVHMYRTTPWGGVKIGYNYGALNKARTYEVWMDGPYKEFLRDYNKDNDFSVGNLTSRHMIRQENKCMPYQYFIDKVKSFSDIYLPLDLKVKGAVYNKYRNKCLDAAKNVTYKVILYPCHKQIQGNQQFLLTKDSQIRTAQGVLLNVAYRNDNSTMLEIRQHPTNWFGLESYWSYSADETIVNLATRTCLTADTSDTVQVTTCTGTEDQKWSWNMNIAKT